MLESERNINWELAARVLSGEADEIDRGLLDQWLHADPANEEEWERIKTSWRRGEEALFVRQTDIESAGRMFVVLRKNLLFRKLQKAEPFL